jgi:penicillin-insensitive murein DD-endopeptidase
MGALFESHRLRVAAKAVGVFLVGLCSGCIGTPTPLHPHLQGSIGFPHSGVQTNSIELPVSGPGFLRYRPVERVYWGQPRLVHAIATTARQVKTRFAGGPPIVLGDISARGGGNIPRHNSHRTGRDIDILWSVMTPEGQPVRSPGFIKVGPDGLAIDPSNARYYRLDLERQWQVVRALLESEALVQWLFCATWIEAMLIEYARALGEPDDLIWRAQTVLLQPADSLPHDDHLHLRVACSPEQAVTGCLGGGPHWEWLPPLPTLGEISVDELAELVASEPTLAPTSVASARR